MTDILTDAVIEKAKKAYWRAMNKGPGATHSTCLRAALKAVLPDIIEACAKVAEEYECGNDGWTSAYASSLEGDTAMCAAAIATSIAYSIRSLSPKQKD